MAIDTIKFKRGVKSKLNNLSYGEPAYISDENELYIGTEDGVEKITRNKEVAELSSQLEQNMNEITIMSDLIEKQSVNISNFEKQVGDTSDSERIQRAIDYVSTNKLILNFDSNIFVVDKPLKLKNFTYLVFKENSIIKLADNINNINIFENDDIVNGNTNITIEGGEIDGNNSNNTLVCGIMLIKCKDVNIKKLKVYNCSKSHLSFDYCNSAVNIRECQNFYLEKLKIHDNSKVGLQITGDCNGTPYGIITNGIIDNCDFYNNGNSGVDTSGSAQYVTIKNCLAYNNGLIENSFQISINCAYNFIENCKAYRTVQGKNGGGHFNVGHSKVDFPNSGAFAPNSVISNCVAQGFGVGLNVNSSDNVVVNNFTQTGNEPSLSVITCYLSKNVKIDNFYGNCGGSMEQVNIQSCPNITVTNGVLYNSQRGGIKVFGSKNATIKNNKVVDYNKTQVTSGYSAGISVSNLSDNANVSGNIFINDSQTAKRGIYIENSADVMLSNNRIDNIETPITSLGSTFGENYIDKIKVTVNA